MKFLVDAHLPRQLAISLQSMGYEAIHTLDLPHGNRTTDSFINDLSITQHYIVITKDSDFVDTFILRKEPWKLFLISTGNIRNQELMALLMNNLTDIANNFQLFDFIEINRAEIILHF